MKTEKEKMIIMQNQSHMVETWFKNIGIKPDLFDVAMSTDLMAEFIINGATKDIVQRFNTMQEYLDKKYKKS